MHFHGHSMQKSLFLGFREGILIKLLIKATTPMVWLRVVYALFGSLASLEMIPLVAPGINVYVFLNRFISRIENKFKPPRSNRGFLFEGFFQKSLQFHLFLSSHSDLFIQQLIYLFWLWLFLLKQGLFGLLQGLFLISNRSRNNWTNSVDHRFSGGMPGFWDNVINMKCKQSKDVSTLAQKYSPVFKKTTVNSERVTHKSYIKLISWVAVY